MNTCRPCGCKSFKTCIVCEAEFGLKYTEDSVIEQSQSFTYCPETKKCRKNDDPTVEKNFPGIKIIQNFVTEEEERQLVKDLDDIPWDLSQSGRRKQNFGPRANFNKRKTKVGAFKGFPETTKFVQDRFCTVPLLEDYRAVEQCSIEYRPETGASIEPHIDDCWIWGERIVQLNLLSDTFLTFIPYFDEPPKYNLADVATYPRIVDEGEEEVLYNPFKGKLSDEIFKTSKPDFSADSLVNVLLPARSLLVMYGQPRYDWQHCIWRKNITERRIVIAYRELTPLYLPGGKEEVVGGKILEEAAKFWSSPNDETSN